MKRVVTTASGLALAFAVSVAAQSGSTSGTQGTSGTSGTAGTTGSTTSTSSDQTDVEQQRKLEDCHGHRLSRRFGQQLDADERLDERRLGLEQHLGQRPASGTGSSGSYGSTAGTTSGSGSTTGTARHGRRHVGQHRRHITRPARATRAARRSRARAAR